MGQGIGMGTGSGTGTDDMEDGRSCRRFKDSPNPFVNRQGNRATVGQRGIHPSSSPGSLADGAMRCYATDARWLVLQ